MSSTENRNTQPEAGLVTEQDGEAEGTTAMNDEPKHPRTGRKRLLKQIAKDYFAAIGVCAVVIGVVIPIFPDILPHQRP